MADRQNKDIILRKQLIKHIKFELDKFNSISIVPQKRKLRKMLDFAGIYGIIDSTEHFQKYSYKHLYELVLPFINKLLLERNILILLEPFHKQIKSKELFVAYFLDDVQRLDTYYEPKTTMVVLYEDGLCYHVYRFKFGYVISNMDELIRIYHTYEKIIARISPFEEYNECGDTVWHYTYQYIYLNCRNKRSTQLIGREVLYEHCRLNLDITLQIMEYTALV